VWAMTDKQEGDSGSVGVIFSDILSMTSLKFATFRGSFSQALPLKLVFNILCSVSVFGFLDPDGGNQGQPFSS